MANIVCSGCKAEIPETAEFCAECGYIVKSPPLTECPECSAMVVFTSDACPECGFPRELLGTESESPATALDNEIEPAVITLEIKPQQESFQQAVDTPVTVLPDAAASFNAETSNAGVAEISALLNTQIESLNNLLTIITSVTGNYEKANSELINRLKEQNLLTLSGMQELLSKFNAEFNNDSRMIKETSKASSEEIRTVAEQAKEQIQKFASKISYKAGNTIDYTFFICAAMLLFSMINLFVTAYIVRLIK